MEFTLNGTKVGYSGDPEISLLSYLREEAGITSPKKGCNDEAACGCCSVQVNGKGALACVVKMKKVEGAEVISVEGMDLRIQEVFADAFV